MEKIEIENLILKQAYDWWARHGGGTVNSIFEKTEGVEGKVFSRVADKLEEDNLINGLGEMLCEITGYGILEAEKRGLIDSEKVSHYENIRFEILKAAAEAYEAEGRYGQAESKKIIEENNFDVDEFHDNVRALVELNLIDSSNGWYIGSTELGREQFENRQQQNSVNREFENISELQPNETGNNIQTKTDSEKVAVVHEHDYDVALSFAGENREYVEAVAKELKKLGVRVFYDNFETANLWGKDLYTYLQNVYQKKAKYTVIFVSEHYAKKHWTNHERKMAQARAFTESREYILPARFDDTEIEGILATTGYVDLSKLSPQEFCNLICEKLGFTNSEKITTNINESQLNDESYPPISLNQTSLYGYITGSSKIRMLDRRLADMYGLTLDTTQDSSLWLLEQAQRLGIENVAELDEAVKANSEIAFNMGRFWRPQEKVNAGYSLSLVFQSLVAQLGSIDKIKEFYDSLKYTSGGWKDILDNYDQALMYAAKDTKNAIYILEKLWTRNGGVNITSSSQEIPTFPTTLSQYRPAEINKDYWDADFVWKGAIRIFEGGGWTEIWNFPHTMNHCSDGVFMIRWRSANPEVRIATTASYSVENASDGKIGQFGYMYGTNCEQPLFKFVDTLNGNESNLVDIYYELKFWQAAP